MHETCDAIVIGGGPAGSLSARFLAQLGWDVTIIERGPRHRVKTCGHCLNPLALPILAEAGVRGRVEAAARSTFAGSVIRVAGGAPIHLPLGGSTSTRGLVIARSRLDQILLDAAAEAGARVLQPCRARLVDLEAGRVDVSDGTDGSTAVRALRAPLIVGADGLRSAVARAMMGDATPKHVGRKFGCSFSIDRDQAAWRAATGGAEDTVHMVIGDGAYVGLVRDGRRLHVGLLADTRRSAARHPLETCRAIAREEALLRVAGLDHVTRASVRDFVAAGPMPWRARVTASERAALVGDAAGYVDPFTGEGMLWAMKGAAALRDVVARAAPGAWTAAHAARYRRGWKAGVGARHHWCGAIAALIERPRLVRAIAPCLSGMPSFGAAVARRAVPA